MDTQATKRPWLAAVLAILITGLGHLYLREWIRAIGWFALVTFAFIVFVPQETILEADPLDAVPVLAIVSMSAIDAYAIAKRQNEMYGTRTERCPSCGKDVEVEVDFCWYCASPLQDPDEPEGQA